MSLERDDLSTALCGLVGEPHGERIELPLREGRQTVGRSPDADLRLSHPNVSRRHAEITVSGGEVMVMELGSRNGTAVAASIISGAEARESRGTKASGLFDVVARAGEFLVSDVPPFRAL